MNVLTKTIFAVTVTLGVLIGMVNPQVAYAQNNQNNEFKVVTLAKTQVIQHDYFAVGETVTLSGTVNGDAYLAGGNVVVEGTVNGDLLVAGGTVVIRGTVTQDVRVAGGQVTVSGVVGRNISTVGGSVNIDDSAKITGSLAAATGNLTIFAPIGKEMNVAAGQITLGSTIQGDVQAGVGQMALTPNAKILGNLTYWSENKAHIDQDASVSGKTTHYIPPQAKTYQQQQSAPHVDFFGLMFFVNVVSILSALLIGFMIIKFTPVYAKQTADVITQKPLLSLGIGILTVLFVPVLFLLLVITIIGIPLAFIMLAVYLISLYLAKIFVAIALGQKILTSLNKKTTLGWIFVCGLGIYYILSLIPILGFFFWMLAGTTGLGALIIQKKEKYTELQKKGLI